MQFPRHQEMRGIVFISLAIFAISVSDAMMKWLVMEDVHPVQLLAVRSWITLGFFILLLRSHGREQVFSQRWKPQLLRGLVGSLAPILFFLSLQHLPLAEATALFFCSTFIMVMLSAIFLGESVGVHRWSAVIVGFSGILLITRPGTELFRVEALYAIGASLFYAIMVVSGRWLSRTDSILSLVFYFNLALLFVATLALPWFWQHMNLHAWLATLIMAILTFLAHLGIARAFQSAPVAVIAPFEYSAMLWATLLGFLVWRDLPDHLSFAGMAVIIGSGLYIVLRENRRKPA